MEEANNKGREGSGNDLALQDRPGRNDQTNELVPEENEETNDGSDTARVVDSASSFARECLKTESYKEAMVALQSALEIANPSSISYKVVVLHTAQLLKAANQLEASIECMLTIYQAMPAPFTRVDGICIIAQQYEQLNSSPGANYWWKKLSPSSSRTIIPAKLGALPWESMGDRLFDREIYVFAAGFYGQALEANPAILCLPSIRFRYRYLSALLEFVGPQGSSAHMTSCKLVAWSLAQCFRRHNGNSVKVSACYGDPNFYRLRSIYSVSFPAMYRMVFAWVDGPAGRIARWWRRGLAARHKLQNDDLNSILAPSSTKVKFGKNQTRHPASSRHESHQSMAHTRAVVAKDVSATSSVSPSPMKRPFLKKKCVIPLNDVVANANTRAEDTVNTNRQNRVKRKPRISPCSELALANNNASTTDDSPGPQPAAVMMSPDEKHKRYLRSRSPAKKNIDVYHRTKQQYPGTRPSSTGADKTSVERKDSMTRTSSSTSLLEVYPLQLPSSEDFVLSCGRQPGFADLDLDEVGQFARLAHYRARVLTGEHFCVESLDTVKVKPQWQQDLERAVNLVENQQQRNLASGKVVVDGDSAAHLADVHTRVVLQLTTICRQYTRDFGETSFTRQLRKNIRRLVEWKFLRISDVLSTLDNAKATAMQEEKQRNLEFYHVHRTEGDHDC